MTTQGLFSNLKLFSSSRNQKKITFPVRSESKGVITLHNGIKTKTFDVFPNDLDQMTLEEIEDSYSDLKKFLHSRQEGEWLKFTKLNGKKIYVTTPRKGSLPFPNSSLTDGKRVIANFFGGPIPYGDITFHESYLQVNGEFWSLVSLDTPFTSTTECCLDDFETDYVLSFRKVSTDLAKKELMLKRRSHGVANRTIYANHEGEDAFYQVDEMLKDLSSGNESLFKASVWFIVKASGKEHLDQKTRSLIENIKNNGGRAFLETRALDYFFNHCLIGTKPSFVREFPCNSHYLSNLIPYTTDFLHDRGLEFHTIDGTVNLDFFPPEAANFNTLVTGQSGQGKSLFVGNLIYHLRKNEGVKLGIFDLGGGFSRLAKVLDGELLNLKFNPLQFFEADFLFNFCMAVIGEGELDKKEKGKLRNIIRTVVEEGRKFNNFSLFVAWLSTEMDGISYYFAEIEDYISEDYISPPDVFYIDKDGLPDSIIAPYLVFARRLSDSRAVGSRVVNVYDECWSWISNSPEYLRAALKTGRKNNISNILVTQEIVELSSNYDEVADAIIGNSYTKIFFYQPDFNHPAITKKEKFFLGTFKSKKDEYSEFLYSNPNNTKVLRFYASRFIFELVHTDPSYLQVQKEFISKYEGTFGFKESFNRWVNYVQ